MSAVTADDEGRDDKRSTRELLIDLAAEAFVAEGFASVSIRQLAKRSRMTSGAIYGNFDNKGDLLMEVIDARIRTQLEVIPRAESKHLTDVLADIFAAYPDRSEMRALLLDGAAAGRSDPEVRRRLAEGQAASLDSWAEAYLDLQQAGELAPDLDPRQVVTLLWSMEVGLGILEAIGLELPVPSDAGEIVRRMVAGLRTTPPPEG